MNRTIPELARLITIALAVPATMVMWYKDYHADAIVFLLTAVWAIASFLVLELLVKSELLVPGKKRNTKRILLLVLAKFSLYGVALWAMFARQLPPYPCIAGFSLLMVSIVTAGLVSGRNLQSIKSIGQDEDD